MSLKMSALALNECVAEFRVACRRPLDEDALHNLLACLRPQFEEILDHPDGAMRWIECSRQMRENGRHLGALADFFGHQARTPIVGPDELARAFALVRGACSV